MRAVTGALLLRKQADVAEKVRNRLGDDKEIAARVQGVVKGVHITAHKTESKTAFMFEHDGVAYTTAVAVADALAERLRQEPAKPAEPVKPVKPVEPVEPAEPAEPAEPVKAAEPAEPVKPASLPRLRPLPALPPPSKRARVAVSKFAFHPMVTAMKSLMARSEELAMEQWSEEKVQSFLSQHWKTVCVAMYVAGRERPGPDAVRAFVVDALRVSGQPAPASDDVLSRHAAKLLASLRALAAAPDLPTFVAVTLDAAVRTMDGVTTALRTADNAAPLAALLHALHHHSHSH